MHFQRQNRASLRQATPEDQHEQHPCAYKFRHFTASAAGLMQLVQAELDNGVSYAAMRRFNDNVANLSPENWGECQALQYPLPEHNF
jgi:hypothetical protein